MILYRPVAQRIGADKEKQLSQISTEISGTAYFIQS